MTGVLIRRGEDTERHVKENPVKTEIEMGFMLPHARECLGPSETERDKEGLFPTTFVDDVVLLTF